jgi:hypothetical protein
VGFQTVPPSGVEPPPSPDDEPPEPELDPPALDPLEPLPPELDPPELDAPPSLPGSGFVAGDAPDEPQAVHEANAPSTRSLASRSVAMAQRNSIVR